MPCDAKCQFPKYSISAHENMRHISRWVVVWVALTIEFFSGCLIASESGAITLKVNSWSPIPNTQAFNELNEQRLILSSALRPKGSDWMLIEKGPFYNTCAQGVWAPDIKKVFMIIGNPYSSPPCSTYSFDPNFTEKVPEAKWGVASGWKNLNPKGIDFNGRVLWASLAYDLVNKEVVLFGGTSADPSGSPGTRVYNVRNNTWMNLDFSRLPLAKYSSECDELRLAAHLLEGRMRSRLHLAETADEAKEDLSTAAKELRLKVISFAENLKRITMIDAQEKEQIDWATPDLVNAVEHLKFLNGEVNPSKIENASKVSQHLQVARDWLAVEPSPRALTSMVYDPGTKKIYLFGGDHLDYLMSDTWAYDCASRRWRQLRPKIAPEPRAGHVFSYLPKSKKIAILGGFGYDSPEGYRVPPYTARPFEIWLFSPEQNEWTLVKRWPKTTEKQESTDFAPISGRAEPIDLVVGPTDIACAGIAHKPWEAQKVYVCPIDVSKVDPEGTMLFGVKPGTVVRRTGKFLPSYWDEGLPSNSTTSDMLLKGLQPNKWADIKPSKVFGVNRDWGTATYDTDRQQILWFSGGHCAYSGTDVSMFSTRANSWRISCVSDFPLGAWANTGQAGLHWSFEGRPFMHSHTYKLYAYDPKLKKMLLFNRDDTFIFDPAVSEWARLSTETPFGGGPWVPKFCTTPEGVIVWAPSKSGPNPRSGLIWRFDIANNAWVEVKTSGGPLPGTPSDDHGTIVYDLKRKQLLLITAFRDGGGEIWSCDFTSGALRKIVPENPQFGPFYPRESVYIPSGDLVLFQDMRDKETIAYDVGKNCFVTINLSNSFPAKNPSVGLMYDGMRDLVWAVDASWNLKVLKFDQNNAHLLINRAPK